MKHTLIALLVMLSISARAQYQPTIDTAKFRKMQDQMYYAGTALKDFSKSYYTGVTIQLTGVALIGVGVATQVTPAFYFGGALALVGGIIEIASHKNIKRAGIHLRKAGLVVAIN